MIPGFGRVLGLGACAGRSPISGTCLPMPFTASAIVGHAPPTCAFACFLVPFFAFLVAMLSPLLFQTFWKSHFQHLLGAFLDLLSCGLALEIGAKYAVEFNQPVQSEQGQSFSALYRAVYNCHSLPPLWNLFSTLSTALAKYLSANH